MILREFNSNKIIFPTIFFYFSIEVMRKSINGFDEGKISFRISILPDVFDEL